MNKREGYAVVFEEGVIGVVHDKRETAEYCKDIYKPKQAVGVAKVTIEWPLEPLPPVEFQKKKKGK